MKRVKATSRTKRTTEETDAQAAEGSVAVAAGEATATATTEQEPAEGLGDTVAEAGEIVPIECEVISTGLIDARELIIDETQNGRKFPHTAKAIQGRAKSMLANGQRSPIQVRRTGEGRLSVVFGYLRALGGVFIAEHKDELLPPGSPDWLIRYEEVVIADDDIIAVNGVENLHREELNDVDLLHLIQIGAKRGVQQKVLAARLELSATLISRVKALENLNVREIKMVSLGRIGKEQARELAQLPPAERKPFVDAMAKGTDVTVAQIKAGQKPKRTTKRKQAAGGDDDRKSRSAKEIGLPFESAANHVVEGEVLDAVQKWCLDFGKFKAGGLKAGTLIGKLYALAELEVPGWVKGLNAQ